MKIEIVCTDFYSRMASIIGNHETMSNFMAEWIKFWSKDGIFVVFLDCCNSDCNLRYYIILYYIWKIFATFGHSYIIIFKTSIWTQIYNTADNSKGNNWRRFRNTYIHLHLLYFQFQGIGDGILAKILNQTNGPN